jgi:type IV pilus assembly protein PilV
MKTLRYRKVSAGFTMLEVLISIVVVAFGLLGLAGLQLFSLKNNQSAALRIVATSLANDIVDRMKSNYVGVINGAYNQPNTASYTTAVPGCETAGGCDSNSMAQNDLQQWAARVAAALPGGVGIVCLDSTPDDGPNAVPPTPIPTPVLPGCDLQGNTMYVVKIWWVDDRSRTYVAGNLKYIYTAFNP